MAKLARKYGIAAIVASEKMKNRNFPKNTFKDQMRIVFPLVSSQHSFSDFRSSMAKKGRNTDIRPVIPGSINQNPWAHLRSPMDMIFQG